MTNEPTEGDASTRPPGSRAEHPLPAVSLAPRRNLAIWLVLAGVLASLAVAVLVGGREGTLALASLLVAAGLLRALLPGPGPVGLTVRSRGVDVFFFWSLGAMIASLAVVAPAI
ncbi:DUF3017 domain-containing protein [Oerskovia flava]|uniref:DUF3017 domain-containing protein n=1 Tax=Oerskovia flava TaxID=2986422 RepID=UPI0022407FAC|nr:DUF3017 domain-containing protein [Oerskovia sp. JB1-3-2]